jgi:hypothetical protein
MSYHFGIAVLGGTQSRIFARKGGASETAEPSPGTRAAVSRLRNPTTSKETVMKTTNTGLKAGAEPGAPRGAVLPVAESQIPTTPRENVMKTKATGLKAGDGPFIDEAG